MALPLLLRGEKLSLLERSATTVSASQTPDALYPLSNLYDTRPSQLFIFPTAAEDDYLQANLDQYLNGDFENWTNGDLNDHTVNVTGTGAVTEETTSPIWTGGSSMQMENGASGTVEVLQDIEVLAGESVELRYASETSAAGSPATMEVYNPITGKWLTTSGTWSARRQNAIESVLTTMGEATLAFTVEDFADVRKHSFDLEIRYHMDQAAVSQTHHWDAVRFIVGANFASIHAHNMSAGIIPRLVSSDIDLSGETVDRALLYDGTNDYSVKTSEFTGLVDGKEGTISFWFELKSGDGTDMRFISNGTAATRFTVYRTSGNKIRVLGLNAAAGTILDGSSTTSYLADGVRHHCEISYDLLNTTLRLRVDGSDDLAGGPTVTNDTLDYTFGPQWNLMALGDGTEKANAEISELWFDDSYIDVAIAANEALFRTSAGQAAVLGENGELVTGTAPILYWTGDDAATNEGTGGDFDTVNGAPTSPITLEAEMTKQDISFYSKLASTKYRKYWKLHLRGTNAVDPIEIGQWVFGEAVQPAWSPRLVGNRLSQRFPQSRSIVSASGEQWAVKKAKHPIRSARMRFNLKIPQQAAFRDELLARTFQGANPMVLVEDQSQPLVIHGRIPQGSDFTRRSRSLEFTELVIEESSNGVGLP
ncbi:MAG: LamG domain-containing protein [Gammaproteobacteria bacterium]|nr:LamG domain-containing protein [Gammaproteobacteria bacterium]